MKTDCSIDIWGMSYPCLAPISLVMIQGICQIPNSGGQESFKTKSVYVEGGGARIENLRQMWVILVKINNKGGGQLHPLHPRW